MLQVASIFCVNSKEKKRKKNITHRKVHITRGFNGFRCDNLMAKISELYILLKHDL
jgi:hypothetical protein